MVDAGSVPGSTGDDGVVGCGGMWTLRKAGWCLVSWVLVLFVGFHGNMTSIEHYEFCSSTALITGSGCLGRAHGKQK